MTSSILLRKAAKSDEYNITHAMSEFINTTICHVTLGLILHPKK